MNEAVGKNPGGLLYYLYQGTNLGIYPPLIFLCLGASTDFGPFNCQSENNIVRRSRTIWNFCSPFLSNGFSMTPAESGSVGIIGGADGPTAIFVTTRLAPHLLSAIALAAYSYMALVPIIQPPIIRC